MSTTSLKLTDELKQRAATAAQGLGISTHAFMVEAIRHAAEAAEQRSEFVDEALAARAEMQQSGVGYASEDVQAYLRNRISDKQTPRPDAKSFAAAGYHR